MRRRELSVGLGALAALAVACTAPRSETTVAGSAALSWNGVQTLFASDSAEKDQFGYAVAMTDARAIVGAYGESSFRGAAYVFVRSDDVWIEEQKLVASDGVAGDNFGWSVALSGERALVGAYGADAYSGAAYVFARSADGWWEEHKLVANDAGEYAQLGYAVGIDADQAVVGAHGHDASRGAAYAFSAASGSWDPGQKLLASDGLADDDFGFAVAVTGHRLLIGAPGDDHYRGAAYVFEREAGAWSEAQKLIATDGVEYDQLGNSVALAPERALIGAYWSADLRGVAHVFNRTGGAWAQEQVLVASDGAPGHRFANSVSLDGPRALIGASGYDAELGAAYVFSRGEPGWSEEQKLLAGDGDTGDLFAWSVSLAGERALVGATYADQLRGKAYAFALRAEPPAATPGEELDPEPAPLPCSSGSTCASGYCEDGLCCDRACSASERCRADLKVSGADGVCGPSREAVLGAACKFDVQCTSGRCRGGSCVELEVAEAPPRTEAPAKAASCAYAGAARGRASFELLLSVLCVACVCRSRLR